jgi:GNAT superfamily N-acetyltransferase
MVITAKETKDTKDKHQGAVVYGLPSPFLRARGDRFAGMGSSQVLLRYGTAAPCDPCSAPRIRYRSRMIRVQTFSGNAIEPHLDAVAELRIAVFRDWPYLYEGTRDYERKYLATYAKSPESLFVLAFDGERVVGASTGIPLTDETAAFQQPFSERGIALGDVFYFGESVLLKDYRGHGLGHRFFDEREGYARRLGRFNLTAFCSVERDAFDPRKPAGFRPNDVFWNKRGYARQDDMFCAIDWQELGASAETSHRLRFWLRALI